MEKLVCDVCNGDMELTQKGYVCIQCGKIKEWESEDLSKEIRSLPFQSAEKNNKKILVFLIAAIIAISFIVFFVLYSNISNLFVANSIPHIIKENGYERTIDSQTVQTIKSENLNGIIEGIPNKSNNKLLLLNFGDDKYAISYVNFKSQDMKVFDYGTYFPLKVIATECLDNLSRDEQIDNFNIIKNFIEIYGFNCFENDNVSEEYIRKITEYISVNIAREKIEAALPSVFPNYHSINEFKVIYEDNTALPIYYAFKTSSVTRNPSWDNIGTNNLNSHQMQALTQNLGPMLFDEVSWNAYDRDFVLMDSSFESSTYNELEKLLFAYHKNTYGLQKKANEKTYVLDNEIPQEDVLYHVRKSADDSKSQLGAFKILDNAKKLAYERKADGYEVYDSNGYLIYEP